MSEARFLTTPLGRTMLTISTLDSDILQSILVAILNLDDEYDPRPSSPWTKLIPLSLVSTRLRFECLPHLFRECRHSIDRPGKVIPKRLRGFIKVLRITEQIVYFHDIDAQALAAKELWEAFPDMTSVTTCIYTRLSGPDVSFVKALTTLPSLSSLELVDSTFQMATDPQFNLITGLTRVVFRFTYRWSRETFEDRWNPSVIQREAYYIFLLLSSSRSTLEYIEIPGETACPEELSEYHWPCLRHLVLDGVVPDRSLGSWLRQAPLLCELDIQCFHAANSPQFFIYPHSQFDEAARLPDIQSLTLANPSPKDNIFDHLSHVHYLSFPARPLATYSTEGVSYLATPIWDATQAKEALLRCRISHLVELRISVQDHGCLDLINTISQAFPSLVILELHRYRVHASSPEEQYVCSSQQPLVREFQAIPFALATLPRLTHLRLDLNLRSDVGEIKRLVYKRYLNLQEATALYVAKLIPQLKSVSMLYRMERIPRMVTNPGTFWRKFKVSRNDDKVRVILD